MLFRWDLEDQKCRFCNDNMEDAFILVLSPCYCLVGGNEAMAGFVVYCLEDVPTNNNTW